MPAMETFRSLVEPTDCDFLGHMNVARYFAACSDGIGNIETALGLTGHDQRSGRRLCFAVVHAESDFLAELQAGDSIYLKTDIAAVGTKSMTFRHRLYRADDEILVFSGTFKSAMFNVETRQSAVIPDDVRENAKRFIASD